MSLAQAKKVYEDLILEGMSRTLWLFAYAQWAEETGEAKAGPGQDWDDIAPETPEAALTAAQELAELIEESEGSLTDLFEAAWTSENDGAPFEYDDDAPAPGRNQWKRRDAKHALAEEFGSALAHMCTGSGVSWWDDHEQAVAGGVRLEFRLPSFECHFDGEELSWSGKAHDGSPVHRSMSPEATGDPHKSYGTGDREIIVVNGSDKWMRHSYVLWFGRGYYGAPLRLLVYADSLDDALEEAGDYIVEHAKGLLATEQVHEEYTRLERERVAELGRELEDEERWAIQEEAEVDTTSIDSGNHYLHSDQWGIELEDPTPQQIFELAGVVDSWSLIKNPRSPRKPPPTKIEAKAKKAQQILTDRLFVHPEFEGCDEQCPGWAVFETRHGLGIQACDECNSAAKRRGMPQVSDDQLRFLPAAKRALQRTVRNRGVRNRNDPNVNPASPTALVVGDLIARVEAPTVLYRVTSSPMRGYFRILPFQRSGKEIFISLGGGRWTGDGSVWTKASQNPSDVTRCTRCRAATHPTDLDDNDTCAQCQTPQEIRRGAGAGGVGNLTGRRSSRRRR